MIGWKDLICDHYKSNKDLMSNAKLASSFIKQNPTCKLSYETLRRHYFGKMRRGEVSKPPGNNSKYTVESKGDTKTIDYRGSEPVTNEEDAIKLFQIDTDKWEIEKMVHSVSEVSARVREQDLVWKDGIMSGYAKRSNEWTTNKNYQCKVWLVKRKDERIEIVEERLERLFEKLSIQSIPRQEVLYNHPTGANMAAVINLFDAHIDKLVLSNESNVGSDIHDNIKRFEKSFGELISQVYFYNPNLIYFPVGNDFWTTNGPQNTTKKGTPQQISTTSEESFDMGFELLVRCIDKAMGLGKVIVPVIKGNHDEDKTHYLGHSLDAYYHKNPNVVIDRSRHQRKYYRFGVNMFGFAHGDKEKRKLDRIPLYMAEERKEMWAQTMFRTFYLGDIHHENKYKLHLSHDGVGVEVKFLRALTDQDKWHTDEGYIGILKTAYAEIWDHDEGRKGGFEVTFK